MTSYNGHLLRFQGCWHLKDSKTLQERKEGNYCFHIYCVPHEYGSCSFITEFDSGGSMWKKCKGENFNSRMTHKCLINVLIIIHHRQEHFFNLLYIYLIYIYIFNRWQMFKFFFFFFFLICKYSFWTQPDTLERWKDTGWQTASRGYWGSCQDCSALLIKVERHC